MSAGANPPSGDGPATAVTAMAQVHRLWSHTVWADSAILAALERLAVVPPAILREAAHIAGAGETWLSRLEGRPPRAAVWPELELPAIVDLTRTTHEGYAGYLRTLRDNGLERPVAYVNSEGRAFETRAGDILMQVVTHGQYHRGKVNLLLRQAGHSPAPVDFISYVRGVPAATRQRPEPQR